MAICHKDYANIKNFPYIRIKISETKKTEGYAFINNTNNRGTPHT